MIEVIHGMTEHIGRYEELAKYLCDRNIALGGFDLKGHGKYLNDNCASLGKEGWKESLNERFPDSKHILMGFSLGSFLAREYLSIYPENSFYGAIVMGTGQQSKLLLSLITGVIKGGIKKVGFDNTSDTIRNLSFGTYNKHFKPNRTHVDWLCSDINELDIYRDDPLCSNDISAGLFLQLIESMIRTADLKTYQNWNKNIPVLLISGDKDPVGDFTKGIYAVEKSMKKAGLLNVEVKLYKDARHDILHENKIKNDIYEYIYQWINLI